MNRRQLLIGGGALAAAGIGAAAWDVAQNGTMDDYAAAVAALRTRLSEQPEVKDCWLVRD